MNGSDVLEIARQSLLVILIVAGPVMLVTLVVGLSVSIIQSLVQIQESTLSFIPKIISLFLSLLLFFPFMSEHLVAFTQDIMNRVATSN